MGYCREGSRSATALQYRQLAGKTEGRGQRTRFNDARGSCRLFCNADCDPLIGQVAIEQNIVFDLVHADRHPMGLIGPFERRQFDPRPSCAQHDGRHVYMQSIETSCRDKARHGISAALNQNSAHPCGGQRRDDSGRSNVSVLCRQSDDLNAGGRCGARAICRNQQTPNTVIGEQLGVRSEAPSRIDNGTRRLWTSDLSDRQLRVVSQRRSNADHDNVDQRAQPVQMFDAGRTVDVLRVARRRRDPTVKRLADLPNNHEIVHRPGAQRAEQIRPGLRQGLQATTKTLDKALPRIGKSKFAGGEIAKLHGRIRFSRVMNDTIGHSILKIHLISGGMIQDFRCSTNAPSKRNPQ
jgi:hypothetical protein